MQKELPEGSQEALLAYIVTVYFAETSGFAFSLAAGLFLQQTLSHTGLAEPSGFVVSLAVRLCLLLIF
jgi:hypothetical protein